MDLNSTFKTIRFDVAAGVGTITLNRPEVRNALDLLVWDEMGRVIDRVEVDDQIRVLVITGAGDKAFASGADIRSLQKRTLSEALQGKGQRTIARLEDLPKPVIAAVNGFALGGGCELAMACDIRIASDRAKFGQPEVNIGVLAAAGGTQRLIRLVGAGKAMELLLTGDIIDAHEALRIGLVNKVVPHEQLGAAVQELCDKLLRKAPLAMQLSKLAARSGTNINLQAGLSIERLAQAVLLHTEDYQEGTTAFLEKRSPQFKGQ